MLVTTVNYLHCLVLQTEFAEEPGTVLEVDFFHANQLLPLTDDAVIQKVSHRCIDVHENEHMKNNVQIAATYKLTKKAYCFLFPVHSFTCNC